MNYLKKGIEKRKNKERRIKIEKNIELDNLPKKL